MTLTCPIPVLYIADEAAAQRFYVDWLRFRVDWEHRFEPDFPLYLQLSRDDCRLHLSGHKGDCSPGAALRIGCHGVETLLAEFEANTYRTLKPGIVTPPWGGKELTLTDPFSNRLTFYEMPET